MTSPGVRSQSVQGRVQSLVHQVQDSNVRLVARPRGPLDGIAAPRRRRKMRRQIDYFQLVRRPHSLGSAPQCHRPRRCSVRRCLSSLLLEHTVKNLDSRRGSLSLSLSLNIAVYKSIRYVLWCPIRPASIFCARYRTFCPVTPSFYCSCTLRGQR